MLSLFKSLRCERKSPGCERKSPGCECKSLRCECGVAAIEYALIVAVIGGTALGALHSLQERFAPALARISVELERSRVAIDFHSSETCAWMGEDGVVRQRRDLADCSVASFVPAAAPR